MRAGEWKWDQSPFCGVLISRLLPGRYHVSSCLDIRVSCRCHSNGIDMSADKNSVAPGKRNYAFISMKVHRIKQMLKPMMKLLHKKCHGFENLEQECPVPETTTLKPTGSRVSEVDQNSANEALESRLRDDLNQRSEESCRAIRVWREGRMTLIPVTRGHQHIPIPVRFVSTPSGEFAWVPLPDSDICWPGDVQTTGQTAEEQVPLGNRAEL